jgi:3-oxoacyl-(acyl-carrier-protein) synthase
MPSPLPGNAACWRRSRRDELVDAATGHIAILTGAAGPNMAVASACATGSHALGEAMHTIILAAV